MAFNCVKAFPDLVPLRKVLVSVYDKTGLADLVKGLARAIPSIEFYSTGGTHAAIAEILAASSCPPSTGIQPRLIAVSEYTGQPEMEGGLVKTLDWKIYLGLLAETGNRSHEADLTRFKAVPFDLVIGNLYPFEAASRDSTSSIEDLRQRIDIGGPAMIRAAAKNFLRVISISSPAQYEGLLVELARNDGKTSLEFRRLCAAVAFDRVSKFDAGIAFRIGAFTEAELSECYQIGR